MRAAVNLRLTRRCFFFPFERSSRSRLLTFRLLKIHHPRNEPLGMLPSGGNLMASQASTLLVHQIVSFRQKVPHQSTLSEPERLIKLLSWFGDNIPGQKNPFSSL